MKTKMMKTLFTGCMLAGLLSLPSYAQVTIGSDIEPLSGALLDLKEKTPVAPAADNTTAAKGLLLPRVSLTDLNKLYPMLPNGYAAAEDAKHTGLTVYNVNQCPAGRTIYDEIGPQVWNGSRWESLRPKPEIVDATPTQTSETDIWGTAVVHHAAKAGVYEEFYSAHFGAAGRWMTTNLAAWKYDGINHSTDPSGTATGGSGTSRTLEGPNGNIGNLNNTAYWSYPGLNSGSTNLGITNPMAYNNNPHLGLLYTWDAATAGKGGANGQGTANEGANNTYARVQGVCPAGWHLPSDYEWTELENAIIKSTTSYANVSTNIDPGDNSALLPQNTTAGPRGTTHGQAMKDICGVHPTDPNGLSNNLATNGFNGLLAGYTSNGSTNHFGNIGFFWSSSSNTHSYSWQRYLKDSMTAVYKSDYLRYYLFSVRCKKD
jgi:uncharacterized protein (TIGR02145 family)